MLKISDLCVSYGRREELILKHINAEFDKKTLLLGPNGAGKTTLFRTICGLTVKISGKIYIDNIDLDSVFGKPGVIAANIPEIFGLLYLDCYRLLDLYMDLFDSDKDLALSIMEEFGLSEGFLKKKKPHQLSAGQRKIFHNAIALAAKARIKLFDEPFEQLDPARKNKLIEYLEKEKAIIILSTHETWLIRKLLSWDVTFMFEGQLFGKLSVKELSDSYLVFEKYPGALLTVETPKVVFSIIKEPKGKPLADFMSLDYVYKLA